MTVVAPRAARRHSGSAFYGAGRGAAALAAPVPLEALQYSHARGVSRTDAIEDDDVDALKTCSSLLHAASSSSYVLS
jgi:hypothetical protein